MPRHSVMRFGITENSRAIGGGEIRLAVDHQDCQRTKLLGLKLL